jgi:hypothetical protein
LGPFDSGTRTEFAGLLPCVCLVAACYAFDMALSVPKLRDAQKISRHLFFAVFAIRYETRSRRVMGLVGAAARFRYLFGYREEPFGSCRREAADAPDDNQIYEQ